MPEQYGFRGVLCHHPECEVVEVRGDGEAVTLVVATPEGHVPLTLTNEAMREWLANNANIVGRPLKGDAA
jgi:hypothetical protein